EAAREHDDRFRQVHEPELAHEEIMEMKRKLARHVAVVEFFHRDGYRETHVDAARLRRPAIRRLHDSRAAPGANDEATLGAAQLLRPLGEPLCKLARVLVVLRHLQAHLRARDIAFAAPRGGEFPLGLLPRKRARRTHEYDRIVDTIMREPAVRLHIFGEYA